MPEPSELFENVLKKLQRENRGAEVVRDACDRCMKDPRLKSIFESLINDEWFQQASRELTDQGAMRPGLGPDVTVEWLALLAISAVTQRTLFRRSVLEQFWVLGTRKSWKAMKNFPERLRVIADEVESVHASRFFNPEAWIRDAADQGRARLYKREFRILPGVLRLYAEHVRLVCDRLPALSHKAIPPVKQHRLGGALCLSMIVRLRTGTWHDAEVRDILNAAANAAGQDFEVDTDDLAGIRRDMGINLPPKRRRT